MHRFQETRLDARPEAILMASFVVGAAIFTTAHIATTAAITGGVALVAGLLVLWRKSASMPKLNNDGLSPFSANDGLAPTLAYVVLGMYASVRRPGNDRRFAQARALAVLAAFAVNVVTI
jgi:hypothetical protein